MPRGIKGRQPKEPKVVSCYHCNYETKIKSNLKKHIVNVHVLRKGVLREKSFNCPMCQFNTTRTKMIDHYSYEHNVSMSKSCLNFLSLEDFRTWKTKVEKEDASRYVVLKGVSKLKTCHVWYYRCHRDGFFNSKGTGKRNIKVKGTNKINGCCPSEMKVMEDKASGKVQVHFVKTHFGHLQDLNRLPLLKEDKDRIAEKLALKIPLNKVLDEIQNSKTGDQLERIHLVTRKDVLNIASSYKLKSECVRRSSECVCSEIENWVKDVEHETNIVRFYKAQGDLNSEYPELGPMDFILIVMNDVQLEYLKFFGSSGICIDRTHQRSQHDFELTTIFVTDDLRQGFPCAYMLGNRSDKEITSIFIKVITNYIKCPITCEVFMSDVADFYFDAWCNTMPIPSRKMFSTWHVDRAWRRLLMKIKTVEKRNYAYKIIKSMQLERDTQNFEQMLQPNIKELKSDPEISSFAESFEEEFGRNSACWAHCYRINDSTTELNCTHLETMHKSVKNLFSRGKKAKRLDTSMYDVMKLVRDRVYDQSIVLFKGVLPGGLVVIKKRHDSCMLKTDVVIEKMENSSWKVHFASEVHDVTEHNLACNCGLRCEDCRICVHSYRCGCNVGTLEWYICQHVHFVASSVSELVTQVTEAEMQAQHVPEAVPVQVQLHHVPQVHQVRQQVHQSHLVVHQHHQVQQPQRLQHVPQHHIPQHVLARQQVQHMQQVTRQSHPVAQTQSPTLQTQLQPHPSQQVQHAFQQAQPQQIQNASEQIHHTLMHRSMQVQHTPQQVHHSLTQVLHTAQQVHHTSQPAQHTPQQVQHTPQQVQHTPQEPQNTTQQVQHTSQQVQHSAQQSQHPPHHVQHPPQHVHVVQAQHVSSQTVNGSDDDDDQSMEVLHICETNVACELEDLILKQFTKPKQKQDSDLRQAKNDALKLVQDIFDAVETRTQLEVFTNAISPVLPTITAMKYSGNIYK